MNTARKKHKPTKLDHLAMGKMLHRMHADLVLLTCRIANAYPLRGSSHGTRAAGTAIKIEKLFRSLRCNLEDAAGQDGAGIMGDAYYPGTDYADIDKRNTFAPIPTKKEVTV